MEVLHNAAVPGWSFDRQVSPWPPSAHNNGVLGETRRPLRSLPGAFFMDFAARSARPDSYGLSFEGLGTGGTRFIQYSRSFLRMILGYPRRITRQRIVSIHQTLMNGGAHREDCG